MTPTYFRSTGAPIQLDRVLGRGGEGTVSEVVGLVGQVAKIYKKQQDAKKQAKLRFMAEAVDPDLLSYVAWPQDTLHSSVGGPVVGYLMPKAAGKEPVHMVYSPAHRKQDYPESAWDFLLVVARNIAASFEALHGRGLVIGDVNQSGVMVGRDTKVVLIDSDSFQVNAHGILHLCEVGVADSTPPELQAFRFDDGHIRTTNHDNFGLALLIFHVLIGGRHPYSGVGLKDGVGDVLATDIKNFRYAYARDSRIRGIGPPPGSIPISILPGAIEQMFQLAFTEAGVSGSRPTAQQWVLALDGLRSRLTKCSASSMHVFPSHLSNCPWCEMEMGQQGFQYFVDLGATHTPTATGFVLTQAWALIQGVPVPAALTPPGPSSIRTNPRPLPTGLPGDGTILAWRMGVVGIAIFLFATTPKAWFFWLIAGGIGCAVAGTVGSRERAAERARRQSNLSSAKKEYDDLVAWACRNSGPDGFLSKQRELAKLRDEYIALPLAQKEELDKLLSTAQTRQRQKFLATCYIDKADISGLGSTRKAMLRSFGMETAADVSKSGVRQVRGFGASLTRAVMDWQASCERRFVFNPANAISAADRSSALAKCAARKSEIERVLSGGAAELQRFAQAASGQLTLLQPQLKQAATKLAQAQSDMTLV